MLDDILTLGTRVRDFVLSIAGLLVDPAVPGVVTLGLVLALVVAAGLHGAAVSGRCRALAWMRGRIAGLSETTALDDLTAAIDAGAGRGFPRRTLAGAWTEYAETLVRDEDADGRVRLRNAVRPGLFFNMDDLHFGPGFWRVVPGLFVMVGLFLTFLGLIAALSEMNLGTQAEVQQSLRALMAVASAKFIMSLTGLFCSIVFTIVLRIGMGRTERAIHELCVALERRLTFISLEDVTIRQLRAIREQRDLLRDDFLKPLADALPAAIAASVSAAITPQLDRLGSAGADGLGAMVTDLSTRFSGDIGRALTDAAGRIGEAGDRIGQLVARMDQSSDRMGSEMEGAAGRISASVEDLRGAMTASADTTAGALTRGAEHLLAVMNQTLEGIRDNTGAGARAMAEAAGELRGAAQAFRSEITAASREASDAARSRLAEAGAEASGSIDQAGRQMLAAVDRTGAGMDAAVLRLAQAVESIQSTMGTSAETASGALTRGADHLLSVMNQTLEGIRDNTGSGARAMAEAAGSLRGAAEAFRAEISAASREASDAARSRLAEAGAEASGSIDQAGRQMLAAVDRTGAGMDAAVLRLAQAVESIQSTMATSAETASGALTRGADHLLSVMNQTLEGIRDNTGSGARAMAEAAGSLRGAAEAFRAEISAASREASEAARSRLAEAGAEASGAVDAAGRQMLDAVDRSGAEMLKASAAFSERTSAELLVPLDGIAALLRDLSAGLGANTTDVRQLADGMRAGAEAAADAAGTFRAAARDLVSAAEPVRRSHERIEGAVRQFAESTTAAASAVTRSSSETARSATAALASAEQLLGGHARAIEATLVALAQTIERLKGQGARLDDLDEKLGRAFDVYTDRVGVAVDGLYGHVKHMQAELAPALDVLNTVVAQAETFVPERRRG